MSFLQKANLAIKAGVKAFTSANIVIDPSTGKKTYFIPSGNLLSNLFDNSAAIDTNQISGQKIAFERCSAIQTVISRKVRAHLNGKYYLLDQNKKEVNNPLAKKIKELMAKPNLIQTWAQFEAQAKIYIQVFGECFILTVSPAGFDKKTNISSLWVIPNWMISRKYSGKVYYQNEINKIIEYYRISSGTDDTSDNISPDNIINIKDFFISSTNILDGKSRMAALKDPINNIISAFNARKTLIKKRGAIGILSNYTKDAIGAIPLTPEQKTELQQDFQKYGLNENQWQVVITNASLAWQSMTFPTKDLMLFEEVEDSTREIADAYEYPMYLLGFKSGTTFSNVGEAKKTLYTDCIIPEANSFCDALNKFFDCEANGFTIQVYFDHLDIFQKSIKDKAEGIKMMNDAFEVAYRNKIVTREEWRIAIDFDATKFEGNTFFESLNQNPNAGQ